MPAVLASLFNVHIAEVNTLVRFLKRRTAVVGRVVFILFKLTCACQSVCQRYGIKEEPALLFNAGPISLCQ